MLDYRRRVKEEWIVCGNKALSAGRLSGTERLYGKRMWLFETENRVRSYPFCSTNLFVHLETFLQQLLSSIKKKGTGRRETNLINKLRGERGRGRKGERLMEEEVTEVVEDEEALCSGALGIKKARGLLLSLRPV